MVVFLIVLICSHVFLRSVLFLSQTLSRFYNTVLVCCWLSIDLTMAMTSSIPPSWSDRGYVPPEKLDRRDDEDVRGEAAYMRAFHESSKMGRVPNASFYVNSPTARDYIARKDKELFRARELSGKLVANPDIPSWRREKESPKMLPPASSARVHHQSSPSQAALSASAPSHIQPARAPISPTTNAFNSNSNGYATARSEWGMPSALEPPIQPSGPPKMLR